MYSRDFRDECTETVLRHNAAWNGLSTKPYNKGPNKTRMELNCVLYGDNATSEANLKTKSMPGSSKLPRRLALPIYGKFPSWSPIPPLGAASTTWYRQTVQTHGYLPHPHLSLFILTRYSDAVKQTSSLLSTCSMAGPVQSGKSAGSRLKPVSDPLESVGFVSKGDKKYADNAPLHLLPPAQC